MINIIRFTVIILSIASLQSCAALGGRAMRAGSSDPITNPEPYVYIGVKYDASGINGADSIFWKSACAIDMIPSAIIDTVLLPYDGICYWLYNEEGVK